MRIVFLGDSLTWGGYGGDFVAEVARLLPQHEIINAGNGGDTVVNLLNRLDKVLELQPDAVFVMVGGNDAISYSQPKTRTYYRRRGGAPPDGAMTLDLFTRSYRDLLTQLQAHHIHTWVGLEPAEHNPDVVAAQRRFNEQACEVAEALRVPVLDLFALLVPDTVSEHPPLSMDTIRLIGERSGTDWNDYETERRQGGFTYSFDGMHLTPETANRIAQEIVKFLQV